MAVQPKLLYPAQIVTTVAAYPYGKARNDGVPGDASGTPLEKAWVNDLWGFLQAILVEAGVSPSGQPDKVGSSQYLDALRAIVDRSVGTRVALSNWNAPMQNGEFYAVASNPDGSVIVAAGVGVTVSTDGGWTWTPKLTSTSAIFTDVIWDGTQFAVLETGASATTGGGFSGWHWTGQDGDSFINDHGVGGGSGDICECIAYDPSQNVYVAGSVTGKVFSRHGLGSSATVATEAIGLAPINAIGRGTFAGNTAFVAACSSGSNGGLRFARPNALGLWTSISGTISAQDWRDVVYSATLDRWFAISHTGDMMSMNSSGTDIRTHPIEGVWSRQSMALIDDRQVLVVGESGYVAFGDPDDMRTIKLNTNLGLFGVSWNGRVAYAATAGGVIRSFSR